MKRIVTLNNHHDEYLVSRFKVLKIKHTKIAPSIPRHMSKALLTYNPDVSISISSNPRGPSISRFSSISCDIAYKGREI